MVRWCLFDDMFVVTNSPTLAGENAIVSMIDVRGVYIVVPLLVGIESTYLCRKHYVEHLDFNTIQTYAHDVTVTPTEMIYYLGRQTESSMCYIRMNTKYPYFCAADKDIYKYKITLPCCGHTGCSLAATIVYVSPKISPVQYMNDLDYIRDMSINEYKESHTTNQGTFVKCIIMNTNGDHQLSVCAMYENGISRGELGCRYEPSYWFGEN